LTRHVFVTFFETAVLVPGIRGLILIILSGKTTEFDKSDTAFHQAPREQALATIVGSARG
jgi:hypothetical protein